MTRLKKRGKTASTRELGLDIALIFARYLFQTDHLHYGFWTDDLPLQMSNLRQAQENYSDFLLGHIPPGVETILDVGMGTGAFAKRLIDAGYHVDCVSPSPNLTRQARVLLGDEQCIFECRYEDLQTDRKYDLILFSESFQYIKMDKALSISCARLRDSGYILICDFFRNETPDAGPFGGGHPLKEFHHQAMAYPLRILQDKDITAHTAPNIDLVADAVDNVLIPVKDRLFDYLSANYSLLYRSVHWIFRKKIAYAEQKYFAGKRRGATFKIYKSYRLLLFQQRDPSTEFV